MFMDLHAWSVHGDRVSVGLREQLSQRDPVALVTALHQQPGVREAFVLSTCQRFEIYGVGAFAAVERAVSQVLNQAQVPGTYRQGEAVVAHGFRVASGLDSQVLGEHYITHQWKQALQQAQQARTLGPVLNPLLQRSQHVSRQIRTRWQQAGGLPTYEDILWSLLPQQSAQRVLLWGAGQLGQGLARSLARRPQVELWMTNRSSDKLAALRQEVVFQQVPWAERLDAALQVDTLILAVPATDLLTPQAWFALNQRPITLVDLGMPGLPLAHRTGAAGFRYLGLDAIKNPACHHHLPLLEQAYTLMAQAVQQFTQETARRLDFATR